MIGGRAALVVVLAAVGAGSAAGLDPANRRHEFASPHMGTQVRIVLYADDAAEAEVAARAAFARIEELDERLSDYRDTSEVSALARAAGTSPLAISPDLVAVLQAAQDLARRSEGAFDVTCGPLSRVWRRARRTNVLPEPREIAEARALVGFARLELGAATGTARLPTPGMRLDLGAIAKGYAADEALRTIRGLGLEAALVELGGEVVAGAPPPGRPGWRVVLPGAKEIALLLADAAVSTSGDAEQWLESSGVRYSHVFDTRSGEPLRGRRSVTVVAPRGIDADSLATAASVLGPSKGRDLVDATPGAAMRFVEEEAGGTKITESARFAGIVRATLSATAAAARDNRAPPPAH